MKEKNLIKKCDIKQPSLLTINNVKNVNKTPVAYSIDGRLKKPYKAISTVKSQPQAPPLPASVSLSTQNQRQNLLKIKPIVYNTNYDFHRNNLLSKSLSYLQRKERNPLNYVYIKDPLIKELTMALLNSEKARQVNGIGSNKLTLVEHKNCSLLLSKNGSDPLNNRANRSGSSRYTTFESKFFNDNCSDYNDENNEDEFMLNKRMNKVI